MTFAFHFQVSQIAIMSAANVDAKELMSIADIKANYPLHWLVWNNDFVELQDILSSETVSLQRRRKSKLGGITLT